MKVIGTKLPGVMILDPRVFEDERGFFLETFNSEAFREAGLPVEWAQDNHSRSSKGVLRGIHYQEPEPQGKLVRVVTGRIFDVAVDIRRGSPTFGAWAGVELSEDNHRQLWIPEGFGHGFCVLSDIADVVYKCTSVWRAENDRGIRWDDPMIGIDWPVENPIVSPKDQRSPALKSAEYLPRYEGKE